MSDDVMSPEEVAELFGVTSKTVVRWSDRGLLPSFRTLGGHRRFHAGDVRELLARLEEEG